MKRQPSTSLFVALFCTLFSVIFGYTLSIMASPYIAGDLGGSNDIATYTVSFFALGNALGVPLGRTLFPRIGAARFLVIAIVLFALLNWAAPLVPTFFLFNVTRFLQGFVSGPFYALCFYLFSSLQPPEKKKIFTAITMILFTIGPVLGACWGGWIAYEWDWRWIFYINVPPLLLLASFLAYRLQGFDAGREQDKTPFDGIGYAAYCLSIFCLSTALIMGQELDWYRCNFIILLTAIGAPTFLFFLFWESRHPSPILYIRLLKNPILSFALMNLAILFSAYFGMIILLSLWLKLWVNYTPDWIAALLAIMALTGLFPILFFHRKIASIDNRIFLVLSLILLILSCYHTMIFNIEINFSRIATSRLLAGLGLAFFLAPLFRLCFQALPQQNMLHILGLFQVIRALSSGLGASLYDVLWQRRQVFFHERLGEQLTPASIETQTFYANAEALGLGKAQTTAQLEYYLQREATSLALDDCFYFMAWILMGLLCTFLFTFFAKKGSFANKESA